MLSLEIYVQKYMKYMEIFLWSRDMFLMPWDIDIKMQKNRISSHAIGPLNAFKRVQQATKPLPTNLT